MNKKARKVTFLCYYLLILNLIASFFILLSRESDGGAMHKTNPDWLRSCPCFRVFQLSFHSLQYHNNLSMIISLQPEKMFSFLQYAAIKSWFIVAI